MTYFRSKSTGILYTIEHLVKDLRYTNNNQFAGLYCSPIIKGEGDCISFISKSHESCKQFIEDNFHIIYPKSKNIFHYMEKMSKRRDN